MTFSKSINNQQNFALKAMPLFSPWVICLSASLFFLFTFLQTSILNSISTNLLADFKITTQQLSSLSSTYFLASAIFFIPVGLALDYFSTRKLILLGLVIAIIGAGLFAIADSYRVAEIARFVSGISYDFALLSCFKLAWDWLRSRIAFALGISTAIGLFGNLLAQAPIVYLTQTLGWRTALWISVAIGFLILLIVVTFIRDLPDSSAVVKKRFDKVNILHTVKKILVCLRIWLFALYACILNTPLLFLGDLWGNLYLTQTQHLTSSQAAKVVSMLFLGLMTGCPTIGWLSDYLKNRRFIMMLSALLMLLLVIPLFKATAISQSTLIFLCFGLGFFAGAQALCYPSIAEKHSTHLTGIVTGLLTTLIMLGNSVLQQLFGFIINLDWNHILINKSPYYMPMQYQHALAIMPVAFIISLVVAAIIYE